MRPETMKKYVVVEHKCDFGGSGYALAFPFSYAALETLMSLCAGYIDYNVTAYCLDTLKGLENRGVNVRIFRPPNWAGIKGLFGACNDKSCDELLYAGGMFGVFQKPRKPSQVK